MRAIFLAITLSLCAPALAGEPVKVALDFSSGDASALGFEKRLMVRLVQEGFAIVPAAGSPDVVIVFTARATDWCVTAGVTERCVPLRGDTMSEVQLELTQKAVQLARDAEPVHVEPPPSSTSTSTSTSPSTSPSPSPSDTTGGPSRPPSTRQIRPETSPTARDSREVRDTSAPSHPRLLSLEGAVGLDALIRGPVDPLVRAEGRLGFGRHLAIEVVTGIAPSSGTNLQILEWQLQGGLGYRFAPTRKLTLEPSLVGGVVLHHFSSPEGDGNRYNALGSLVFKVGARLSKHVGLELRIAPGLADHGLTHERNGAEIWSRSRYRLEIGLAVTFY
jgi:hypothetical protein